jgi:hypothetical protein
VTDELAAFEAAVVPLLPSGPAVICGSAVSPDGRYGALLTIHPDSRGHPLDWLFERIDDRWRDAGGGSAGVSWNSLSSNGDLGVLRYEDEAPPGASTAVVLYEGREHRAPVREGWFLLAVWDTAYTEDPRLLGFE